MYQSLSGENNIVSRLGYLTVFSYFEMEVVACGVTRETYVADELACCDLITGINKSLRHMCIES